MCDCLEKLSPATVERGIWINRLLIGGTGTFVCTSWYPSYKPKRGEKCPVMLALYCPFCGEKYEEPG